MSFNSKKTFLITLGITAILCSRAWFTFINDPEGPNLLVVAVLAAILYGLSLAAVRLLGRSMTGPKKLFLGIATQVIIAAGLYFFLN